MYTITREIGIDAGHRVWTHGSKCKNLHGHRYTVRVVVGANTTIKQGEQSDMVLDFGFLKEVMMLHIDAPCDHGFIIDINDPRFEEIVHRPREEFTDSVKRRGSWSLVTELMGKFYIVPFIPTAEKLAEHWFWLMRYDVFKRSEKMGHLLEVEVKETPNCFAVYKLDALAAQHYSSEGSKE